MNDECWIIQQLNKRNQELVEANKSLAKELKQTRQRLLDAERRADELQAQIGYEGNEI